MPTVAPRSEPSPADPYSIADPKAREALAPGPFFLRRGGPRSRSASFEPTTTQHEAQRRRPMLKKILLSLFLAAAFGAPAQAVSLELLNVSYDPTRELYRAVNNAF